jgi:demethylmenaquinone methyltransferase/2-methoxy-6-polyprenyl-1,4-benzoquinol methylase/phosphoethanolamine N-methyltransferase
MIDFDLPETYNDAKRRLKMAHHFHSHSAEQPAQTEGALIRWAPYYDVITNMMTLGQAPRLRRITIEQALIKPGDSVLDVGCGTGEIALQAKMRAREGKVYGIDPAPEMIAVAQRKAARKGLEIDFRMGVIEALPFPDASLDVVTSSLMMHHLPESLKVRGLAEIYRVLKPGGRLLIADFMRPTGAFLNHLFIAFTRHQGLQKGIEDLQILLRNAGFGQITQSHKRVLVIGFVRAIK